MGFDMPACDAQRPGRRPRWSAGRHRGCAGRGHRGAPGTRRGLRRRRPRRRRSYDAERADARAADSPSSRVPGASATVEAMDALRPAATSWSSATTCHWPRRSRSSSWRRDPRPAGDGAGLRHGRGRWGRARVRQRRRDPGPVGIVAASGTGCQQLLCLLAAPEWAWRHRRRRRRTRPVGRGRRPFDARGAATCSTPTRSSSASSSCPSRPAAEVADDLHAYAATLATPVRPRAARAGQPDLTAAAAGGRRTEVNRAVRHGRPGPTGHDRRRPSVLRGLFVGGTLCDEAMLIAGPSLGAIMSNIPLAGARPAASLRPPGTVGGFRRRSVHTRAGRTR